MASGDVYRAAVLSPAPAPPPPVFVYAPHDPDARASVTAFQALSIAVGVGTVVSAFTGAALGLASAAGAAALTTLRRVRGGAKHGAVLEVHEGVLHVWCRRRRVLRVHARLHEVADVVLDVKTIRRVQESGSPVPAVRLEEARVGPEIETARIVVVLEDGGRLELTEPFFAHLDATHWLGRVRVFLRRHGWLPVDERPDDDPADDSADH
jgi:hypothetical protein